MRRVLASRRADASVGSDHVTVVNGHESPERTRDGKMSDGHVSSLRNDSHDAANLLGKKKNTDRNRTLNNQE